MPFRIMLDYWDVENWAHYNQEECFEILVNGTKQTIVPKGYTLPTEI